MMTIEELSKILKPNWRYMAMDLDQNWWVYEQHPVKMETFWAINENCGNAMNVSKLVDIEPDTDWETSLYEVERDD